MTITIIFAKHIQRRKQEGVIGAVIIPKQLKKKKLVDDKHPRSTERP